MRWDLNQSEQIVNFHECSVHMPCGDREKCTMCSMETKKCEHNASTNLWFKFSMNEELSKNDNDDVMFTFQNIIAMVARKQSSSSQFAPLILEIVFGRCMIKGMRSEIQSMIQRKKLLRICYHKNYNCIGVGKIWVEIFWYSTDRVHATSFSGNFYGRKMIFWVS